MTFDTSVVARLIISQLTDTIKISITTPNYKLTWMGLGCPMRQTLLPRQLYLSHIYRLLRIALQVSSVQAYICSPWTIARLVLLWCVLFAGQEVPSTLSGWDQRWWTTKVMFTLKQTSRRSRSSRNFKVAWRELPDSLFKCSWNMHSVHYCCQYNLLR